MTRTKSPSTLATLSFIALALIGILVAATAVFSASGESVLPYILLTAIIMYLFWSMSRRVDPPLSKHIVSSVIGFPLLANLLGDGLDFYEMFPWWDGVLHFLFGVLVAWLGIELMQRYATLTPAGFQAVYAVGLAMIVAVGWEIYEFAVDGAFGLQTQESGLPDTMGDLIVALIGGTIVAAIAYRHMTQSTQ